MVLSGRASPTHRSAAAGGRQVSAVFMHFMFFMVNALGKNRGLEVFMRIGLIAMSGVRVRNEELARLGLTLPQFVSRGKVIASLPSLGLLTVAGLTPPQHDVAYREIADLRTHEGLEPFDLVGISSFTAQIDEAYTLADRYRAAGVPVVLGGLHVSLMPDEAARHADSVVLYGAEGVWPRVVEDAAAGRLKPRYEGLRARVFDDAYYARPRFDLLAGRLVAGRVHQVRGLHREEPRLVDLDA